MPVKMDGETTAMLRGLNLVVWRAQHPKHPVLNEKTGKMTPREDKSWVVVQLSGPGVETECLGSGPTFKDAVWTALRENFADRIGGVRGALLRLEREMLKLCPQMHMLRLWTEAGCEGDLDDFVPF